MKDTDGMIDLKNRVFQAWLMAVVVVAALPVPDVVMAQNLQGTVEALRQGLQNMPNIIAGAFYIGGAAMIGAGALKLKAHSENPTQTPMGHGIGRLISGSALVALPAFAAWLNNSLAINGSTIGYQTLPPVQ